MSPEEKDQKIERLEQENQALRERIAELERSLGLDSKTCSKPPASDGLKKSSKIRTKSLREKGKRPSGGQIGHPGQTLEQVLEPEKIVEHLTPCSCPGCGCDIGVVGVKKIIKRQVFDIPVPRIIVTEHRVEVKECPKCKVLLQGSFPESVTAPVQYGARKRGISFHHNQPPLTRQGNRGRIKRRVGHNLLLRFQNFRGDVLRFLTEPDVPFTNNQAERDLRMMKCKQKISGGFRCFEFAVSFANIRSFISTASKHGLNLLEVITEALLGNVSVFLASITTS